MYNFGKNILMKSYLLIIWFTFLSSFGFSQELLADVTVDYAAVQSSNTQTYKTLQRSLKDFINNTKWTEKDYQLFERIQCTFFITILEKTATNKYKASITIQSRRPVFNSEYYTPILNFQDTDFSFEYTEFETLIFNDRRFSGKNLTDVIAFYVYFILGYDADSFSNLGGTPYFTKAQKISQNSENQGFSGWSTFDGIRARTTIINDILKPNTNTLREIYYTYHLRGLDAMSAGEVNAKNTIVSTLNRLQIYQNNTQLIPLDIFITAKKYEIASIFSGGTPATASIQKLKEILQQISPTDKETLWDKMKN